MPLPPRIGLTQRVSSLPDRDERRDALDQTWVPLLEALGAFAVPIPNRLADPVSYTRNLDLDLLILTGGNDLAHLPGANDAAPERDRTEVRLLHDATERRLPVLGVCRGMQMLVHHHGGTLEKVEGHVAAHHVVFADDKNPRWPLADGRVVNSFHGWGLHTDGIPPGWHAIATAADGSVEAITHPTLPQVGIMWHPERPEAHPADLHVISALLSVESSP